ncbi:hypothetical protein ACLKA7_003191 [Drosophila subpalustris]
MQSMAWLQLLQKELPLSLISSSFNIYRIPIGVCLKVRHKLKGNGSSSSWKDGPPKTPTTTTKLLANGEITTTPTSV